MSAAEEILLIEDESALAASLLDFLRQSGYQASIAGDLAAARKVLGSQAPDLLLLDLTLPDGSGIELLEEIDDDPMAPAVVVLTGDSSADSAVQALRRGAYDYLVKPFGLKPLRHRIKNALEHRRARLDRIVGKRVGDLAVASSQVVPPRSQSMQGLLQRTAQVARHDSIPVLVMGETGVGKEHICRMVHELSPRGGEPFVAVNCAELDRSLLRSELFGHERGAFTGASERRPGLFELASRGTLLLDEVAEMPSDVQATLLRVLEDGSFRRLGGTTELRTNARIIAATNKKLTKLVEEDRFRQDLLFRLNTVELRIPPLRERTEDIRPLAEEFCQRAAATLGFQATISMSAVRQLEGYPWPGNVRELRNVVERSVLLNGEGTIEGHHLRLSDETRQLANDPMPYGKEIDPESFPTMEEVQLLHIKRALRATGDNRTQAAKLLRISRSTLLRKLAKIESA